MRVYAGSLLASYLGNHLEGVSDLGLHLSSNSTQNSNHTSHKSKDGGGGGGGDTGVDRDNDEKPSLCPFLDPESLAHCKYKSWKDSQDSWSSGKRTLLGCIPEVEENRMEYERGNGGPSSDSESAVESMWHEQLESQGLFCGSYPRLLALYTLTPLTTLLTFAALVYFPYLVYPIQSPRNPSTYPPFLPFPLPELLISIAFSALTHLLRSALFSLASLTTSGISFFAPSWSPTHLGVLSTFLSTSLCTMTTNILRVASFAVLLTPLTFTSEDTSLPPDIPFLCTRNPAFRSVWWAALGWAATEAVIGITQGYQAIALYKDVLVSIQPSFQRNHSEQNFVRKDRHDSGTGTFVNLQDGNNKGKQTAIVGGGSSAVANLGSYEDVASSGHQEQQDVRKPVGWHGYGSTYSASGGTSNENSSATSAAHQPTSYTVHGPAGEHEPLLQKQGHLSAIASSRSSLASLSTRESAEEQHSSWRGPSDDGDEERMEVDDNSLQLQVDRDIDQLLAFRSREELEDAYGMPFIKIPVFISCLHRINALLLSLGFSLLLSAAYMHILTDSNKNSNKFQSITSEDHQLSSYASAVITSFSGPSSSFETPLPPPQHTPYHPILALFVTVLSLHFLLAIFHTPLFLPKFGVHTVVYMSFIVTLGTLFVALAVWGGLS
ncbi:hypothetical protein AMATHDRAFT_5426 [Amanita thiersii Skay4041]|uniref:Uncharacterized protein n=1 Tax=Amanita thiersii Skay4041 TaxID=703135 RepID=A0A2A9NHP2_9AGAR|nr:hypothetical protein AMATHDRAFT_5426 [Amanita thiersii Skay4041]